MLRLPNVTLFTVETRAHELARLAIEDCLRVAEFGDVIIYTDNRSKLSIPGAHHLKVEDYGSKVEAVNFMYFEAPKAVVTPYMLFVEWDSGIFDPSKWTDNFLKYDYLGAPWGYLDGMSVGNGGFSLKSKRISDFFIANREKCPIPDAAGDTAFCRTHRPFMEKEGFCWAPEELALDFAFECVKASETSRHFGYHAMRNWRFVFSPEVLAERLAIAKENKYIQSTRAIDQLERGENPRYMRND